MIWAKTNAGRAALLSSRSLTDRVHRTALLAVDGRTPEPALIASLASSVPGMTRAVLQALCASGLIAPVAASGKAAARQAAGAARPLERRGPHRLASAATQAYGDMSAELTRFISAELGVRGYTLLLALEKAATLDELCAVRERAILRVRGKSLGRVNTTSPRLAPRARA